MPKKSSAKALYNQGKKQQKQENFQKAIELFKQAEDSGYENLGELLKNLARCYRNQKKFSEALNQFQRLYDYQCHSSKDRSPNRIYTLEKPNAKATTLINISCMYVELGNYDEAVSLLEKAKKISGIDGRKKNEISDELSHVRLKRDALAFVKPQEMTSNSSFQERSIDDLRYESELPSQCESETNENHLSNTQVPFLALHHIDDETLVATSSEKKSIFPQNQNVTAHYDRGIALNALDEYALHGCSLTWQGKGDPNIANANFKKAGSIKHSEAAEKTEDVLPLAVLKHSRAEKNELPPCKKARPYLPFTPKLLPDTNVFSAHIFSMRFFKEDAREFLTKYSAESQEISPSSTIPTYATETEEESKQRKAIKMQYADHAGLWGERIVYEKLKVHYHDKYEGFIDEALIEDGFAIKGHYPQTYDKSPAKAGQSVTLIVHWYNKHSTSCTQTTNDHDLSISKTLEDGEENIRAVEVKTTRSSQPTAAKFSDRELKCMRRYQNDYRIFRLYKAESEKPLIRKFKNPYQSLFGGIDPELPLASVKLLM